MLNHAKKIAAATLIALPLLFGNVAAQANDLVERQIYQDKNFVNVQAKAKHMLEKRGYHVVEIDADSHLGKPALEVKAYKGHQEYDIKLSYPHLKILKEEMDD